MCPPQGNARPPRKSVSGAGSALPAYWDGVWLDWDHWDLAHDGRAGAFAVAVGTAGIVWFPTRGQVKLASGALFVVSGILLLVPMAWTCHHTSQPLEGAKDLQRDWGPALYLGWISFALMVAGGAFLLTRCPRSQEPVGSVPVSRYPQQEESENPLSTIHRTTFTNSQYNSRAHSEPI
ncbi:unnamed protein product [Arctogadus glacialis]